MANLYGRSEYADVMERALYNGVLCGISLDVPGHLRQSAGEYGNPSSTGLVRLRLLSAQHCAARRTQRLRLRRRGRGVGPSLRVEAELQAGSTRLNLRVETDYPWNGSIRIEVNPDRDTEGG